MDASVVVATRDRRADLRCCLSALRGQTTERAFEIVVVDDGSSPPLQLGEFDLGATGRLVQGPARGPAAARNVGIAATRGAIVLFTDDDTVPDPDWLEAACTFLDSHRDHVGVEGPTRSLPFDELYAFSIENDVPGAYWTCNVAYRRAMLIELGGFCELFGKPHCEDRDLGFRALELGPIGFAPAMQVIHTPRARTVRDLVRGAGVVSSELVLFARHPERYRSVIPRRLLPLAGWVRHISRSLRAEGLRLVCRPRRFARFWAVALGQLCVMLRGVALAPSMLRRSQEHR